MSNTNGLEIERKFLIVRPTEEVLAGIPGAYKYDIEQIYLPSGVRIRKRVCGGKTEYFYTVKQRISDVTRVEHEHLISEDEYRTLASEAEDDPAAISKTRWCLPCGEHFAEVDIYAFWQRVAVVEVELSSEDEAFELPDALTVLREVTGEKSYLNKTMAYEIQKNGYVKEPEI